MVDPDRLLLAVISGICARHASGGPLTAEQEADALAELTAEAGGRPDLLAERAGTALGFGERQHDAARWRLIAALCVKAGADEALIGRVGAGRPGPGRYGRPAATWVSGRGWGAPPR
jgi:hypothetical protein